MYLNIPVHCNNLFDNKCSNGIRCCIEYIDKHIATIDDYELFFNIDTLMMTMFYFHCTCTTYFDGSTVYFVVTGKNNASQLSMI